MRGSVKIVGVVLGMLVAFVLGWVVAKSGSGQTVVPASLTDLEREFTERMQNVALVGRFTIEGLESNGGSPERYEIARVTKIGENRWRFDARITYGGVDVTLPVTLPVVWAGSTPMISITDYSIPGLGDAFTARLLFHDDRYAGTWKHGEVGGLMYGMIESINKG